MALLNIATGTILILLGTCYIRKGLDRLFGSSDTEGEEVTDGTGREKGA
jgi:uncharacterized membrane protein